MHLRTAFQVNSRQRCTASRRYVRAKVRSYAFFSEQQQLGTYNNAKIQKLETNDTRDVHIVASNGLDSLDEIRKIMETINPDVLLLDGFKDTDKMGFVFTNGRDMGLRIGVRDARTGVAWTDSKKTETYLKSIAEGFDVQPDLYTAIRHAKEQSQSILLLKYAPALQQQMRVGGSVFKLLYDFVKEPGLHSRLVKELMKDRWPDATPSTIMRLIRAHQSVNGGRFIKELMADGYGKDIWPQLEEHVVACKDFGMMGQINFLNALKSCEGENIVALTSVQRFNAISELWNEDLSDLQKNYKWDFKELGTRTTPLIDPGSDTVYIDF